MRSDVGARASGRLAIAVVSILLPALLLGYLGIRALSERTNTLRTSYTATVALVRDRLSTELTDLESDLRVDLARLSENIDDPAAMSVWLQALRAKPWLADPFLIDVDGGVMTSDLRAAWSRAGGGALQPTPRLEALIGQAEAAEFVDGDLDRALQQYRQALGAASSETARGLALMRIGRTLFKLRRFDEAIEQYRAVLALAPASSDVHGIPFAVNARLQIIDALDAIGRPDEKREHQHRLLQFVVSHQWDVEDGYGYYLARAVASEGAPDPAMADRARGLTQAVETIQWIRRRTRPWVDKDLNGPPTAVLAQRLVTERDGHATLIGVMAVPDPEGLPTGVLLGYEIRRQYVADAILANVLKDVDLGPEMRIEVFDAQGMPRVPAVPASPAPLAHADLGALFPGWSVALFHQNGRSIEELAARERWIYGTLVAGLILVLSLGVVFTMRASAREAELSRLKTEFVSNVSHELKTPLALIRMFGETLESGIVTDEGKRREFYAIIRRESERLTHLISNVLDVARIDAGTKQYAFAEGDVVALVREVIDAYQPLFDRFGFTVDAALPESPVHVSMDRDAMAQAVVNLFQNAIKYSGDVKKIAVSVGVGDGVVQLSVADHGIGIRHEEIPRIFEKHYRIPAEHSAGSPGSGLGLAIVKHAMDAHGGRVEVESTPERGSVFTLVVPVRHAQA